jgi:hypothetical protein
MAPRVPYFGAGAQRVDGCFHKLAVKGTLFRFTEGLLQFSVHCTVKQESWGGGGEGLNKSGCQSLHYETLPHFFNI